MLNKYTKCICLFLAIWFTLINTVRCYNKASVPTVNLFYQAVGITGYVILQFNLL